MAGGDTAPNQTQDDNQSRVDDQAAGGNHINGAHDGDRSNGKPPPHPDGGPPPTDSTTFTGSAFTETPPDVPRYDADGGGKTKVDTSAIKTFARNMKTLADSLQTSYSEVSSMPKVAAGGFPSAILIKTSVADLQDQTATAVNNMINTLLLLQEQMDAIANKYESTSEANTMSAEKLGEYLGDVKSSITSINTSAR